jgi:hypothetical protein
MRLTTIWTLPACTLREKLHRTGGWALIKIAHRLPTALKYRVFIDVGAANMRNDVVPEVTYMVILQRMTTEH